MYVISRNNKNKCNYYYLNFILLRHAICVIFIIFFYLYGT